MTPETVTELVMTEVRQFWNPFQKELIRERLVTPYPQMRFWEFGMETPDEPECECWIFLHFKGTREGMAYSRHGQGKPGRDYCWGLVDLDEQDYDQESLWHKSFIELWAQFGVGAVAREPAQAESEADHG